MLVVEVFLAYYLGRRAGPRFSDHRSAFSK